MISFSNFFFKEHYDPESPEQIGDYEFGATWDHAGNTSNNMEVNYKGFVVYMLPSEFLSLALPLHIHPGYTHKQTNKFGQPFLDVIWDEKTKIWQVRGHEGRHRMSAVNKVQPNLPVPVHCFPSGMRARHLTPEMLNAPFKSEDKSQTITVRGKRIWQGDEVVQEGDGQYGFDLDPATEPKPSWVVTFTYDHQFYRIVVWHAKNKEEALRFAVFGEKFIGDNKQKAIAFSRIRANPEEYSLRVKPKR